MSEPSNTPATANALPPGHPLASTAVTFTAPPAAPAQAPAAGKSNEPASTDTGGTDWQAEAQKWEKRAKENFDKASKLDALAQSLNAEPQNVGETLEGRIAKAEQAAQDARTEALRYRIAAKHGVSDEDAALFLHGTDADTIEKQAARLAASVTQTPGHVPAEGRTPATQALNGDGLEQALRAKLGIT